MLIEKDIIYRYAMEKLVGFLYNNVEYIYERNIQGDILGIYKKDDLTKVAEYVYDAYGNHDVINYTKENIGDINPIRYRGYYYDQGTRLYYLNSRYYSPEIGRFISPDTLSILDETKAQINGLNLYMYCGDNPVMNVDENGNFFVSLLIGFAIGALIGGITSGISSAAKGNTGLALVGDILGGALIGGALGVATTFGGLAGAGARGIKMALIGLGATTVMSFGAGVGSNVLQSKFRGESIDWKNALIDGSLTAVQSIISFGMGAALSYSGSWNSLNKPQLSNSYGLFRSVGQGRLASAFNGTLLYLEQNGTQILTRTFVKTIFTLPWGLLRNNI